MIAIILAGGFGTRLKPLTDSRPKSLLPLMNKPMITYILDSLPDEVDHAVIAAGYRVDQIQSFFETHDYPFQISISKEEEPLGTGGALKNCQNLVSGDTDLLVFNGDVISSLDLKTFIDTYRQANCLGSIALWPVSDPSRYGLVSLNENKMITEFFEKPGDIQGKGGDDAGFVPPLHRVNGEREYLINAGTYVFKSEIMDHIPPDSFVSIERDVFPGVLDRGLLGHVYSGYWIDAGTGRDYLNAHRILFDRFNEPGVNKFLKKTDDPISKFPGSEIIQPVYFGSNVVIGGNCRIGPYVCLGDNVEIDGKCTVSNTVIMNNSRIGSGSVLTNVIIGSENKIGRDSKLKDYLITADGSRLPDSSNSENN